MLNPERGNKSWRVLCVTSAWPTEATPHFGNAIYRQVQFLRQIGVVVDVFHYAGGFNPFAYAAAISRFRQQLRDYCYDVIHGYFGQTAPVVLSQRHIPTVITFGGTDVLGRRNHQGKLTLFSYPQRMVSRFGARWADEVIVVAAKLGPHTGRSGFHVITDGIDLDLFHPIPQDEAKQALGWHDDHYRVLFIANPAKPIKRFWLAEKAAALAQTTLPDRKIELVVVQGEPTERIPIYMSAGEVLLLTSVHEGSPNVVKEALACNLPVVSVNVGDVAERISHISGCVLCHDDKPETVAAGLTSVLQHRQRIAGRQTVLELRGEHLARRLLAVYEQAIGRRQRA